jgi:hypothetical protein
LTLGAILMLGGVTGGRGQEVSGAASGGPNFPSLGGFVLPSLPENWSESPIKMTATESLSYNNNIFGAPTGFALGPGEARGDWVSSSLYGGSTLFYWSGQQFYFNGAYGFTRYLHQVDFDSSQYNISAGVNWVLTSRCAGTLSVSAAERPSLITEQIGVGINNLTQTSLNETAKCAISNGYALLFNSGWSDSTNSDSIDAVNDVRTQFVAAGISYANSLNSMFALLTIRGSDFTNRGPVETSLGLSNTLGQNDLTLNYVRNVSPNLTLNGQIGATGETNQFSFSYPRTILPHYLASITWLVTPKLTASATANRAVTPPTNVIGNAETSYSATFNLTYQLTPKVSLSASASASYFSAAFTNGAVTNSALAAAGIGVGAGDVYSLRAGLTYAMTPFLTTALTYTYSDRVQDGLMTPQDVIMATLNYKPF